MLMIAGWLSVILLATEPSIRRFGTLSKRMFFVCFALGKRDSRLNWSCDRYNYRKIKILLKRG
jgi:hypothetical protein